MSLETKDIQSMAADFQSYQKGRRLWEQGRVRLYRTDSFWKGEINLQAESEDYRVRLKLSGDRMTEAACSCPDFIPARGLCPHCVAAAFAYLKRYNGATAEVSTTPAARQMLEQYSRQAFSRAMAEQEPEPVELDPVIHLRRRQWSAELKIGRKKKYVVQDLLEFADNCLYHRQTEYGRQLSVRHEKEFFHAKDWPAAELLIKTLVSWRQCLEEGKGSSRLPQLRCLPLNRSNADEFLPCFEGRTVTVEENGENRKVHVVRRDPAPVLSVQQCGSGLSLEMETGLSVLQGEKGLYVADKENIYLCSEDFSREAGIFLVHILTRTFPEYGRLLLSRRDVGEFCGQVLPRLSSFLEINADELNLSDFEPASLKAEFYFDAPSPGCVTCEVFHHYGNISFNPLQPGTLPVELCRNKGQELRISSVAKKYFRYRTEDGKLQIVENDGEIFRLLTEGMAEFASCGEVHQSEAFQKITVEQEPEASLELSFLDGLLEMKLDLGNASPAELRGLLEAYAGKQNFVRRKDGSFLDLRTKKLDRIAELSEELKLEGKKLTGEPLRLPLYRAAELDLLAGKEGVRSREFAQLIRKMKNAGQEEFSVPESLKGVLRDYQKTGYSWLRQLDALGLGGILADEMGLGKTVQVIALLLSEKQPGQQSLIVCPASLVYNWENECHRFAPELTVCSVTGTASERKEKLQEPADVLITSYDLMRRDGEMYQKMFFRFLIVDEAQFIKNWKTQNARAVKSVPSRTRFALTGTPIENRLTELWSIFDFLMPGFLYNERRFREHLEMPILKGQDEHVSGRLNRMVRPFILRRLKSQVLKELPPKLENTVYSKLEGKQKKLYQGSALRLRGMLEKQSEAEFHKERMQVLAELMRLRQICCSPELCFADYDGESAKTEACMELLRTAVSAGHKVLLFSQFTSMLAILRERIEAEQISYFQLTGATPKEERVKLADRFNRESEVQVFLISLKAGGTGLNLTGADLVIHYDPWWNLAAQNQATDRAHRIGQENKVTVYRLIAKDTVEEKILQLQESKRKLAGQVLGDSGLPASRLTREELLKILEET